MAADLSDTPVTANLLLSPYAAGVHDERIVAATSPTGCRGARK
jgi:hypothetical protein